MSPNTHTLSDTSTAAMSSPRIHPTVNLNGTSRQVLIDGYKTALDAVHDACTKFSAIEFNPRDYQEGPGDWTKARIERTAQIVKLRSVARYLEAHLESLLDPRD